MATSGKSDLSVLARERAEPKRLTRREIVQRLLAGAGAGAAWPLVSASHPIFEQLKNGEIFTEIEKLEGAADWKPVFLNAQQIETLAALAESIVPGSTKAKVGRFLDLLLSVDKAGNQRRFLASLAAFQTESQKRFEKDFPALSDEQKFALLADAAKNSESSHVQDPRDEKKAPELHGHFENMKGWISGAYYSSEMGMRELGWTGENVFAEFPGCKHTGEHN